MRNEERLLELMTRVQELRKREYLLKQEYQMLMRVVRKKVNERAMSLALILSNADLIRPPEYQTRFGKYILKVEPPAESEGPGLPFTVRILNGEGRVIEDDVELLNFAIFLEEEGDTILEELLQKAVAAKEESISTYERLITTLKQITGQEAPAGEENATVESVA